MFDSENEYRIATQDAQVNIYGQKGTFGGMASVWNTFLLLLIGGGIYYGFFYVENEPPTPSLQERMNLLAQAEPIEATVVMGVSHTKSDSEYLKMLNKMDVDHLNKKELSLENAMGNLVNSSTLRDKSLYTQAIAQEIDGRYKKKEDRVFLVKKGDTLGSISEKFYGNSMLFNKIIEANADLEKGSKMLHIGQKLNVPY